MSSEYVPTNQDILRGTFSIAAKRKKLVKDMVENVAVEGPGVDFSLKIPADCLAIVCSFLPLIAIRNLSLTNKILCKSKIINCVKIFKSLVELEAETIWQYLCQVHYNVILNTNQSWKQLYKKLNKKPIHSSLVENVVKLNRIEFKFVPFLFQLFSLIKLYWT